MRAQALSLFGVGPEKIILLDAKTKSLIRQLPKSELQQWMADTPRRSIVSSRQPAHLGAGIGALHSCAVSLSLVSSRSQCCVVSERNSEQNR